MTTKRSKNSGVDLPPPSKSKKSAHVNLRLEQQLLDRIDGLVKRDPYKRNRTAIMELLLEAGLKVYKA